ncbi:MAG: Wzy polymerase domain-containing protein [Gallionella sp.]|nr:Wzy polymerase domain-containing protein [Gallionella sp.]
MLKNPPEIMRLTHITLALAGLMWVFPFLHYVHRYPLTTFYQEWWSALLGVLALTLLVARDFWQQPQVPRIAQLPVALIGVVLLQWGLGMVAYFDQALLYVLYLLFATLLMLLGARLRECFGMERLAQVLAIFLLVGAEISALIGVLQHFRWHTPLDGIIVAKVSSSVFGNVAQANHFANYIMLGLVSLGLLFQQKKLKAGYVVAFALPLLLVMTLSGSRSSWLYLLMISVLAWWWGRRDAALRPLLRYALFLLAGFGLMHLFVQLPFMQGASARIDTVQRLFGDDASGGIRLYLWREAALMFQQSPWLGVGFGQFAWHHFQLLPVLQPDNIQGLYNNAHSVIFQLAAEAGVLGLLAFLGGLSIWLFGLRRMPLDAGHWWGSAALGVLAIHSLLEYPLWYTYFVAIAAMLLGMLDQTRYQLEMRNIGRWSVIVILLLGALTLIQLRSGYQLLEEVLRIRPASVADQEKAAERTNEGLVAVYNGSLLAPYAELFLSSLIEVSDERVKDKLEMNSRVLRFIPVGTVAYRQVFLLALDGQHESSKVLLEQAIWSYPGNFAGARKQMEVLAEKDPARFAALLEFALQKQQEYLRAVRH